MKKIHRVLTLLMAALTAWPALSVRAQDMGAHAAAAPQGSLTSSGT